MRMLREAPADTVTPCANPAVASGHESSVRLSAIPDRLIDYVLALVHVIAELAAVAGLAVVAALSAEMAHDLCTRVRLGPRHGRSRPGDEVSLGLRARPFRSSWLYQRDAGGRGRGQSTDPSSSLALPVGAVQTVDFADQRHWRCWS
jgi:hypothetical protein